MDRKRSSLMNLWLSAQVELRGSYSVGRIIDLAKYSRDTTWTRAVGVLLATPLPCLVVTLAADTLPLSHPADGIRSNKMFFARECYAFVVMTSLAINQFRQGVPVLPYPFKALVRDTLLISALTVSVIYLLAATIGFPLPFTILTVLPAWTTFALTCLAIQWGRKILSTPKAVKMFLDVGKLWVFDMLLVFTYPPFFYVFRTLPHKSQTAFALLLPVIKLLMRNLFARAVSHLGDETPVLVIFNADVFGSLFVSYCMQSSPSLWTTLELMAVDIVMTGLALRDVEIQRNGLAKLEHRVDKECIWYSYHGAVGHISLNRRKPTTLERASILLEQEGRPDDTCVSPDLELKEVSPRTQDESEEDLKKDTLVAKNKTRVSLWNKVAFYVLHSKRVLSPGRIHPLPPALSSPRAQVSSAKIKIKYTRKVRRLLYMAEFLLLLNYVEVLIPLVFSIYLVATYHLPNREYYAEFDGMDEVQLLRTLKNVMLYCSLQFVSLLLLVVILKRMLGLSPIQQLAFVLEKQCDWVQMTLTFWLFYNVQTSLTHSGYDYTFQFAWLSRTGGGDPS